MRAIVIALTVLLLAAAASYGRDAGEAVVPGTNGKIAFISDRDGNYEIYVMNADGSGQTRLDNGPGADDDPAWSPDGKRIAFASHRDGGPLGAIYVMNADGSEQTRLAGSAGYDGGPAWSPDGNRIAFESARGDGGGGIYVMNADGSEQTRLTNSVGFDYAPGWPDWSPDGKRIAFHSYRDDGNSEIYVMNADGSGPTRLTDSPGYDRSPAWSPDGNRIAFVSSRDGNREIYVMNADGSGQTRLTDNQDFDHSPAWSPDGKRIAFVSYRDGDYEIYLMNADGSGQTRLTNNAADDGGHDWQAAPVTCTVASVIDGDTFTCTSGKTVDMLQIDAQELGQCGGGWAKAALENIFLTPGREVRLDFDSSQTAGANTLAAPVARGTDGVDYNLSIVMAYVGLAKAATVGANNTRFLDWAKASQAWAQAAQWNMWAPGKTYTGGCD